MGSIKRCLSNTTSTLSINQIVNLAPINAGPDMFVCSLSPTMAAINPVVGTGTWIPVGSAPAVNTPTNPNSSVTFTNQGSFMYIWQVGYNSCATEEDTVIVNTYLNPTTANAGANQTLCISASTLVSNTPSIGVGQWNVITGNGIIASPTNTLTGVNSMSVGINEFEWVISNGPCVASRDTVLIMIDANPDDPFAGPDQRLCVSDATLAATSPVIGTGIWNVLSGGAAVVNTTLNASPVNSLSIGSNYFEWIVNNGVCPPKRDTVLVLVDANPDPSLAGVNQSTCGTVAHFSANSPAIGTGTWMPLGVSPAVNQVNSPFSSVNISAQGTYSFAWVIGNGVCPVTRDTVEITTYEAPSTANAGTDFSVCGTGINLSATLPVVGSGTWVPMQSGVMVTDVLNPSSGGSVPGQGIYSFVWEVANSVYCPVSRDTVNVQTFAYPTVANAGPDFVSDYLQNPINANSPAIGVGTWSVLSGQGSFEDAGNAVTNFISKNDGSVFLVWTITNGVCPPSSDTMEIRINPLVIPQIITPNDDGNNDNFEIRALRFTPDVKLSVFNRWGGLVFEDSDYKNNFNGYNKQGEKLADDTYFYILEANEKVYKGYFVIKSN